MITVLMKMTVRREKRREFLQTILAMVDPARRESGCVSRDLYQDAHDENSFLLREEWKTQQDVDRHFRSDWFHILLGARNLLREEPRIELGLLARTAAARASRPGSMHP
jgi:quinol monooxygenase YgiN